MHLLNIRIRLTIFVPIIKHIVIYFKQIRFYKALFKGSLSISMITKVIVLESPERSKTSGIRPKKFSILRLGTTMTYANQVAERNF